MRHNNVSLISVGKYKYSRDDRFRIVHEHHDEDWILAIKSITTKDQGIYECQVNTSPLQQQTFYLKVVGMDMLILRFQKNIIFVLHNLYFVKADRFES